MTLSFTSGSFLRELQFLVGRTPHLSRVLVYYMTDKSTLNVLVSEQYPNV